MKLEEKKKSRGKRVSHDFIFERQSFEAFWGLEIFFLNCRHITIDHVTWLGKSHFSQPGIEPWLWQWKCWVLTTGPTGSFHYYRFYFTYRDCLFLFDSVLTVYMFLKICPFLLGCLISWHITVHVTLTPFVFLWYQLLFLLCYFLFHLGPLPFF